MAALNLPPAPGGQGTISEQLNEQRRYNALLQEQLKYALENVDQDNFSHSYRQQMRSVLDASESITDLMSAVGGLATKQSLDMLTDTVDGKVTTFFDLSAPSGASIGDLWFDTGDGNSLYRWNGTKWEEVDNSRLQQALDAAGDARSTADGKIVTFSQDEEPTAQSTGDLWIRTDQNNAMFRWNGTSWVPVIDSLLSAKIGKTEQGYLQIGEADGTYTCQLTPTGLIFYQNGLFLGEYTNSQLYTHRATIRDKLTMGSIDSNGCFDFEVSYRRLTVKFRG